MHGAVGQKHASQAISFQPVTVKKQKTFAGFAGNSQLLPHVIEVFSVHIDTDRAQHLITGQQLTLIMRNVG
ncbi:hypothetical protein D3C87_1835380 [compost metagenome]